jgi:hypothetical protein
MKPTVSALAHYPLHFSGLYPLVIPTFPFFSSIHDPDSLVLLLSLPAAASPTRILICCCDLPRCPICSQKLLFHLPFSSDCLWSLIPIGFCLLSKVLVKLVLSFGQLYASLLLSLLPPHCSPHSGGHSHAFLAFQRGPVHHQCWCRISV